MIKFSREAFADLASASRHEWLETNGLGGFACSTVTGLNSRRYHGLFTAATHPPAGRQLLLSKVEEVLVVGRRRFELSTNQYQGAVHPQGYRYLCQFRLDPFPIFTYEVEEVRLEKSVFMVHGSNSSVITYRLLSAPARDGIRLELGPLIAFRDYHSTTHENSALNPSFEQSANQLKLTPYPGMPSLYLAHNADTVTAVPCWYRSFLYELERERGLDFLEDLFNPLLLAFPLSPQRDAALIASLEPVSINLAGKFRASEENRRNQIAASTPAAGDFVRSLALASDQFLVQHRDSATVVAGYPWFTDWGRDTMVALPGLTLFTGKADVARGILLHFAQHVDQGMLPNCFSEHAQSAQFNSADATLWFFEAIRAYVAATGDFELVRTQLYSKLTEIIDWHLRGTRYNIRVLENGLLNAGEPGVQLTWMDAKIGDWVVTPRIGQPVEIQALWFNALKIMGDFAARFGDGLNRDRYRNLAAQLYKTFNQLFWNQSEGCLYDVMNGSVADSSIRPNQIFAVSLFHSVLAPERAESVVGVVERELLTPFGLRTLSPRDPNYRPRYAGDQSSRDSAYHQGTVWPWLLGPFVAAYIKVHGGSAVAQQHAQLLLQPLQQYLSGPGLGQLPEVFDAEPPYRPGGCFAQAWSVAEILRATCVALQPASATIQPAPAGSTQTSK